MSTFTEQSDAQEPALRPPRFSLRTLLLVMSGLCCLFAAMAALGLLWSAVLLLFLSLVAAHVIGNSLGTRLRDHASRQIAADRIARPRLPLQAIRPNVAAPEQLTGRAKLNRITLILTVGGALVGAELGGAGLAVVHPQASAAAVGLGVVSSAVLAGFAGFLASSFLWVVRQALAEAHRGAAPAVRRPATPDSNP
jgi:hypothetical protein